MRRSFVLLALLCPAAASAQEPKVETHSIILHPAAAPVPALRYPLLPEARDLKPGNAALLYQRAHSPEWWRELVRDQELSSDKWGETTTLDPFPIADGEKFLARNRAMIKEIDLAARRSFCDWEMNDRLSADGVLLLVPDLQSFRIYGNLQYIRSRRALAEKKFAEAAQSLQTGFALSQHVAEAPTLIHSVVSVAIAYQTMGPVEEWTRTSGSPNLYWSLTALPSPFTSIRRSLQSERIVIDSFFPGAREALRDPTKSVPLPLGGLERQFEPLNNQLGIDIPKNFLKEFWVAIKLAKEARDFLIEQGRTAAQVDALGPQQTIVLYLVAQYDRAFDEFAKLSSLPFWQAYPALLQADADFKTETVQRPEAMWLARLLMPALKNVVAAQARLDRRIALLRSFEAIRLHAALNKGQLLAKWDDLRGIPIPLDPATGQPFDYRRDGDRAILRLPVLPGRPDSAIHYQISLAK